MIRTRWLHDLFGLTGPRNRLRQVVRGRRSVRPVLEQLEDRITPTGPTLTTLVPFGGSASGWEPNGLIMDSSGDLYGTTASGGDLGNYGSIFEVVKGNGVATTLASFNGSNGAEPSAGLIMDSSGNLYGTTASGGDSPHLSGVVFKLTQNSSLTALASFNVSNGAYPYAGVVMDGSGNLYGTTHNGGASGFGTVFEVAKGSNTITTLASFNGINSNGADPSSGLVMDSSGNLYGTTDGGGVSDGGTIFELVKGSSTITTLASFNGSDATTHPSSLILDSSNNLYGITLNGGAYNDGSIFELVKGGNTITTLASFDIPGGAYGSSGVGTIVRGYAGLVMDANGNLYGTTAFGGTDNDGTVFELPQGSSTITTLASFNGGDGTFPEGGLVMDDNGNLYGTTAYGGAGAFNNIADSGGTVFELPGVGSVATAPTITTQPANQTVTAGSNVSFTASASGVPAPTVQWQVSTNSGSNWTNINGATSTTLTLNTVTPAMSSNEYQAVFANSLGSATTGPATLTVQYAPVVTTNPSNQTVMAGSSATFTAAANGNPSPAVQWQVSTDGGKTFTAISGATSTSLTLNNVTAAMSGNQYQAFFTNSLGTITSGPAALTVTTLVEPAITGNPNNVTVEAGQSANFAASANGNPTPTVQWRVSTDGGKSFTNISGATSATLMLNNVTAAMNGSLYEAVFTNSIGSGTTSAATLAVQTMPTITSGNSATFTIGRGGSFTLTATGSPTPTFTESGALPPGITFTDNGNGTATLSGVLTAGTQGTYYFTITAHNGIGTDFTQSFTLTVNPAPVQPSPPPPPSSAEPPALKVPPLLAFFDSLLGGIETVSANSTETVADSLFGIPLIVATYDRSGDFVSADLLGIIIPNWVWFV